MIKKSFEYVIKSITVSILLVVIGFLIAHFIVASPKSTDLTLFILGAVPIVLFLPSIFSNSTSGGLHTPKVMFRKVDTLEKNDAKNRSKEDKVSFMSPHSLMIAGLLTWLAGFLLSLK